MARGEQGLGCIAAMDVAVIRQRPLLMNAMANTNSEPEKAQALSTGLAFFSGDLRHSRNITSPQWGHAEHLRANFGSHAIEALPMSTNISPIAARNPETVFQQLTTRRQGIDLHQSVFLASSYR